MTAITIVVIRHLYVTEINNAAVADVETRFRNGIHHSVFYEHDMFSLVIAYSYHDTIAP